MSPFTDFALTTDQVEGLLAALGGRLLALCFGAGVDSTAMLVALHAAGIRPNIITFADTGGEKPETYAHVDAVNQVLASWGWPPIITCRKQTRPDTGYDSLYGKCLKNETLPSLAFGMKSCSIKWKQGPQDAVLQGVRRGPNQCAPHPVWSRAASTGARIVKLIGYDCGRADWKRSKHLTADADYDYAYPLQIIGWHRADCVEAITAALGTELVPIKSACFFCPASKTWELFWLAATHPDQFELALQLEARALTGKHSRFDAVEFGATWEEIVQTADRFPSSNTTVGLGRSFAWGQWARLNRVVDHEGRVDRSRRDDFLAQSQALRSSDNALDRRAAPCGNF